VQRRFSGAFLGDAPAGPRPSPGKLLAPPLIRTRGMTDALDEAAKQNKKQETGAASRPRRARAEAVDGGGEGI
jgi:hypothetical protein